jgi:hypothetical protein
MKKSLTTTSLAPKNTGQKETSRQKKSSGHLTTQSLVPKNPRKYYKLREESLAKDSKATTISVRLRKVLIPI